MKNYQYVIKNINDNSYVKWHDKTIIFDSQEEAEQMIFEYRCFFDTPLNVEITKGIYFIDNHINYKNLVKEI